MALIFDQRTRINHEVLTVYHRTLQSYSEAALAEHIAVARRSIADAIHAEPEEIIFVSGATEANNCAFKGLLLKNPDKKHIITSVIEHESILCVCATLEKQGYRVDYIPVNASGVVDAALIARKLRPDTLLVSVASAHPEIGAVQPITAIAGLCHKKEVYFHTDAVQSFGHVPLDVKATPIDMLTISGTTLGTPPGIGFLYVRMGVRIAPLIEGAGEEFRLRSGSQNAAAIIALATAIEHAHKQSDIRAVHAYIAKELQLLEEAQVHGTDTDTLPSLLCVSFPNRDVRALIRCLANKKIYVSTPRREDMFVAMELEDYFTTSIVLCFSRDVTLSHAQVFIESIKRCLHEVDTNGYE